MTENENKRMENFLNELSKLSEKHDMYIGGCGCCGSPYIMDGDMPHPGKYVYEEGWGIEWQEIK